MRRVLLFTGDGKGKTTAALGMVLRAAGRGLRVFVLQFVKDDREVGECRALAAMDGVDLEQHGRGFVPPAGSPKFAEHRGAAEAGLARLTEVGHEARHGVYVLDEVCGAVAHGLLAEDAVLAAIEELPGDAVVVLTGRGAPAGFVELADTVTEMRCLKHGHDAGIPAQPGVEE